MQQIQDILISLMQQLKKVLPMSPFAQFYTQWEQLPYLSWLNWFFPVRSCLIVMAAWLGAVALFYVYSIVMRWVKMIGA